MSMPDVNSMTRDELEAAQAEIAAKRAAFEAETAASIVTQAEADDAVSEVLAQIPEAAKKAEPAPWAHDTMEFKGRTLEVRPPSESALIAVSVVGLGGSSLPADAQIRVFTSFLVKHLSAASMMDVLDMMTDPDEPAGLGELVEALTRLTTDRDAK